MFKASLRDPKLLKHSIDAISNMVDEVGINVTAEGMTMRAMDPAHVALVDFELKRSAFDEYEVGEAIVLGIDLDRLNTILKRAGKEDKINLEVDPEKNTLKIRLENASTRTFNLPLIEVSEEELKVPDLDFPSTVEIKSDIISEGIKDAEIVSDHVILEVDKENFYIKAKGDLGNVEVKASKEGAISFDVTQDTRSMYSLEYLKDMIKASDIADTVKISLGDNIPVKMEFLSSDVKLSFLLAPRIESE
ncbi:proliferating cell nuclear antigen (pcna) [archaeon]|nr:proliferating cell nuclear antigen (pcna) [archaeon]